MSEPFTKMIGECNIIDQLVQKQAELDKRDLDHQAHLDRMSEHHMQALKDMSIDQEKKFVLREESLSKRDDELDRIKLKQESAEKALADDKVEFAELQKVEASLAETNKEALAQDRLAFEKKCQADKEALTKLKKDVEQKCQADKEVIEPRTDH